MKDRQLSETERSKQSWPQPQALRPLRNGSALQRLSGSVRQDSHLAMQAEAQAAIRGAADPLPPIAPCPQPPQPPLLSQTPYLANTYHPCRRSACPCSSGWKRWWSRLALVRSGMEGSCRKTAGHWHVVRAGSIWGAKPACVQSTCRPAFIAVAICRFVLATGCSCTRHTLLAARQPGSHCAEHATPPSLPPAGQAGQERAGGGEEGHLARRAPRAERGGVAGGVQGVRG